jgi:putative ABC transport system permease protein
MLIAHQAVGQKIADVKSSIGNTVTIAPAGFTPGSEANNALTTSSLDKVKSVAHVTNVTETLTDRLTTIGSSMPFGKFGDSSSNGNNQTSLKSPITLNGNGNSASGGGMHIFINGGGSLPSNFSPPIQILGTTNPSQLQNDTNATIKSGKLIDGTKDTNEAMVSTDMANKNNLKVGSTFTAYGKTLTVAGIFDSGSQGGNNTIIVSLSAEQRLSGQSGDVTNAVATVDSLDNLSAATTAIKNTMGSSADVTSSEDEANQAVAPLNSVKSVSLYSLIGAAVAGAVIILLVMVMIVRERRREIGILKAIGGSNSRIILQFMSEALTFTVLGAVIGLIIGVVGGNPVTNMLVTNSANSSQNNTIQQGPEQGAGPVTRGMGMGEFTRNLSAKGLGNNISNIHANIGWSVLAYGLGAALLIAAVGSAFAGWLIARVRPSEVMRAE